MVIIYDSVTKKKFSILKCGMKIGFQFTLGKINNRNRNNIKVISHIFSKSNLKQNYLSYIK